MKYRFFPLIGSLLLAACVSNDRAANLRTLTILYTNDEHGWMEGMEPGQSAAHLYDLWQDEEGYVEDGPFLILSGGDNWTGPAISTWTEGRSMVEVMNAMAYDASAVGNHEFDFGLDALKARIEEADFSYLSANARWKTSGRTPEEIGILPFTIQSVNDIEVGIIGLTTLDTPTSTNPNNVRELQFLEYEAALRETLPRVEAQGADLVLLIAHVCVRPLESLIRATVDLDIAMVGAGHCNELLARQVEDTVLLGGGFHFTAYARAKFTVDLSSGNVVASEFDTRGNAYGEADASVAAIVAEWAEQTESILSEEVGWNAKLVARRSEELRQAVVNSWLQADPTADIAITNAGGIRIDLPAGQIDVGTVVALMPFDNTIVALQLRGSTVRRALETGGRPIVGGLGRRGERWVLSASGDELDDDETYRVLVNNFMYDGGDGYGLLAEADPDGFDTGINYRQPLLDWLKAQNSSPSKPLSW